MENEIASAPLLRVYRRLTGIRSLVSLLIWSGQSTPVNTQQQILIFFFFIFLDRPNQRLVSSHFWRSKE